MLITAHGGALSTKKNSKEFFDKIKDYNLDIIEVDIRQIGNTLFLSHSFSLCKKRKLPLEYAFRFCKEHNFYINCDLKQYGLLEKVIFLAHKTNVTDKILFTGNTIGKKDIKKLNCGKLFLNKSLVPYKALPENVHKIKQYLENFRNKHIVGINYHYKKLSDEFIYECGKQDILISVYTPSNSKLLKRFIAHKNIYNITTNCPDLALTLLNKPIMKY